MNEFAMDIEFKLGVPLIMLDIIKNFTGQNLAAELREEMKPKRPVVRMNPDDDHFQILKSDYVEEYQD